MFLGTPVALQPAGEGMLRAHWAALLSQGITSQALGLWGEEQDAEKGESLSSETGTRNRKALSPAHNREQSRLRTLMSPLCDMAW